MLRARTLFCGCLAILLGACQMPMGENGKADSTRDFPKPERPVSSEQDTNFASESLRDKRNEASVVMELADIKPGMSIADLGAGDGYYTTRLAQKVGSQGRVLAEDIDKQANERLGVRVLREGLDNVSIIVGTEDDPHLPANSFDRIFMVHMYHEISEPYAFLWRMRPALRPNGRVIVVDVDRSSDAHGIAPSLLFCEFASVGFRLTQFVRKPELQGYYAQFEAVGARPKPASIKPCRTSGETQANTGGLQG